MTSADATVQNGARTRGAGALNHVAIPTVSKEDGTKIVCGTVNKNMQAFKIIIRGKFCLKT